MVLKVSLCYIYIIDNIYNSTRSDWLWSPCFLNYFESELFCRDGPFLKNVSFVETLKICYIYSKLVNNPFKPISSFFHVWFSLDLSNEHNQKGLSSHFPFPVHTSFSHRAAQQNNWNLTSNNKLKMENYFTVYV